MGEVGSATTSTDEDRGTTTPASGTTSSRGPGLQGECSLPASARRRGGIPRRQVGDGREALDPAGGQRRR